MFLKIFQYSDSRNKLYNGAAEVLGGDRREGKPFMLVSDSSAVWSEAHFLKNRNGRLGGRGPPLAYRSGAPSGGAPLRQLSAFDKVGKTRPRVTPLPRIAVKAILRALERGRAGTLALAEPGRGERGAAGAAQPLGQLMRGTKKVQGIDLPRLGYHGEKRAGIRDPKFRRLDPAVQKELVGTTWEDDAAGVRLRRPADAAKRHGDARNRQRPAHAQHAAGRHAARPHKGGGGTDSSEPTAGTN